MWTPRQRPRHGARKAAAIPYFADVLGVEPPTQVTVTAGPGRARILDLHCVALVAVLIVRREGPDAAVEVTVEQVLAELLAHEERFWQGSAARAGLLDGPSGLTPEVLRRIVAAGCLLGAATEAEAVALLKRVPGAPASLKTAAWLRDLYPPASTTEWLGSLQPDRLAEQHTVGRLAASPDLAAACLTDLDDRQALRAITLLGRASTDLPDARPLLDRVLPLLDRVVADLSPDLDTLTAIADA